MHTARVELVRIGPSPPDDAFARVGDRDFQICRATVTVSDRTARVAMYWPVDGAPTTLEPDALATISRSEAPDTILAIVRASAEGTIVVDSAQNDAWSNFALAAVAACARYSWAWDDSPAIAVTVNGEQMTLDAQYTDEAWAAVEVTTTRSDELRRFQE